MGHGTYAHAVDGVVHLAVERPMVHALAGNGNTVSAPCMCPDIGRKSRVGRGLVARYDKIDQRFIRANTAVAIAVQRREIDMGRSGSQCVIDPGRLRWVAAVGPAVGVALRQRNRYHAGRASLLCMCYRCYGDRTKRVVLKVLVDGRTRRAVDRMAPMGCRTGADFCILETHQNGQDLLGTANGRRGPGTAQCRTSVGATLQSAGQHGIQKLALVLGQSGVAYRTKAFGRNCACLRIRWPDG